MADYISPTASLLESNTRSQTATQDRLAQRGMKNQELLQKTADTAVEQGGAMQRQEVSGKQAQLLQNLRDQAQNALTVMQEKETSKRQQAELEAAAARRHQEDYFTMTPNVVKGLKSELSMDFSKLEGQEAPASLILAMISAKYKTDIAETGAEARKLAGTGEKDLLKELGKNEQAVRANTSKLIGLTNNENVPNQAWGGKKGNISALISYVSAGNFGDLSPAETTQVKLIAGYINAMKENQKRANLIHKQLGTESVDYTGFGLGGEEQKTYKSAQEVQAAYKGGQLDRNAAKKILQEQFGLK